MAAPIPEDLTTTQKLRGRAVTHEEGAASIQRLINSRFKNDNGARCSIPARADDDDIVASDYAKECRERIAFLEQRAKELEAPLPTDIAKQFAGSTFPAAYPKLVDALNRRVKEVEAENDTLRATVERMKGSVTDAWKQGEGDPAIFHDAEGRN